MEADLDEAEWVQSIYDQLDLIEEKRLATVFHCQLYKRLLKRASEKKVFPRVYQACELLLKRHFPIHSDTRGKWTPKYEGPFIIKNSFLGGDLFLTIMDGDDLPMLVNSDTVKKYYA